MQLATGKLEQIQLFPIKESKQKIDFPFQEMGIELQSHFGKEYRNKIWPLFHRYPLGKIRDAWTAYQKGDVKDFRYFCGILNKL